MNPLALKMVQRKWYNTVFPRLLKTMCFKGPYFRQKCALLYNLNCIKLSGTPSEEVATHTYFSKACPFAPASSKACLLCPLPLSKGLAMIYVFSNRSGRFSRTLPFCSVTTFIHVRWNEKHHKTLNMGNCKTDPLKSLQDW